MNGHLTCLVSSLWISQTLPGILGQTWQNNLKNPPDFSQCNVGRPVAYKFDRPVLVVISMDGLHPDKVTKTSMPHLTAVAEEGLKADHMRPVFPTATFPNHWSIVTGLHPESHGIIDNYFTDSSDWTKVFTTRDAKARLDPYYWLGKPIWQVAQAEKRKVAAFYWAGSEVPVGPGRVRPTYSNVFETTTKVPQRVDNILAYLKLDKANRPDLILNYYHQPDDQGHAFGADNGDLGSADNFAELVMQKIDTNGLRNCVDVMFVSDHGLANFVRGNVARPADVMVHRYGASGQLNIDQGGGTINRINFGPDIPDPTEPAEAMRCTGGASSPYQVYLKEDLPRRWHYSNSNRIAPVILTANLTYTLRTFDKPVAELAAGHGWDNIYAKMRASFIAYGPRFQQKIAVEPFQNVELFGLMYDLLELKPAPQYAGTTGSLRYLLRTPKYEASNRGVELEMGDHLTDFDEATVELYKLCSNCSLISSGSGANNIPDPVASLLQTRFGVLGAPLAETWSTAMAVFGTKSFLTGVRQTTSTALWAAFQLNSRTVATIQQNQNVFSRAVTCLYQDTRVGGPAFDLTCSLANEYWITFANPKFESLGYLFPPDLAESLYEKRAAVMSTNVVPMYASFRNGVWNSFWRMATTWVSSTSPIDVVVGPVYDKSYPLGIRDDVDSTQTMPTHFFVVLTRKHLTPRCPANADLQHSCNYQVQAFVLPHKPRNNYVCQSDRLDFLTHSATVKDVEQLTGLQFFRGLPSRTESARLRSSLTSSLWTASGSEPPL